MPTMLFSFSKSGDTRKLLNITILLAAAAAQVRIQVVTNWNLKTRSRLTYVQKKTEWAAQCWFGKVFWHIPTV